MTLPEECVGDRDAEGLGLEYPEDTEEDQLGVVSPYWEAREKMTSPESIYDDMQGASVESPTAEPYWEVHFTPHPEPQSCHQTLILAPNPTPGTNSKSVVRSASRRI